MKDFRGDMNVRVEEGRQSLLDTQRLLQLNPNSEELCKKEVQELLNFRKLLRYQYMFNCQRARLNWAKEGDLNTKYFHAIIKGRRANNSIRCVQTIEGDFLFDRSEIKEHFVKFFKELFNGNFNSSPADPQIILSGSKVSAEDCRNLVRDISYNEVAEVVKQLPLCKAAGPDGYNSEFFKASWNVCGADIVRSINTFFKTGIMPEGINSAYLALIPKVKNASLPSDFRPISCCNVIYKIVSSLLANRLRPVLDYLVDQSQTAFVKGRNIAYNISLVQELLCKYKQKHVSRRCMMKIDISKAYDMVDWNFLQSILKLYGFPIKFVSWIMACVTSAKFSVLVNGSLEGYFSSCRGLRQGDPISPYLFTLVMEVLSRIIGHFRQSNEFVFHPKCAGVVLSHLMFADDVIIFSKADRGSLMRIKEALAMFHGWSGLEVNGNKSAIFFGGCGEEEQWSLAQAVGFSVGKLPFSYLGVLLDGRSLRRSAYDGIVDKMTSKIKSWASRCLSYAGRLVLVKHVLSTISSYWMRVLLFPKFVLKKVAAICRNFLWSGTSVGKRNLVAWKRVTRSKDEGGLGIKNIFIFNKALLLKQIWDLCLKKDSMWIRWMHTYFFNNHTLWEVAEKNHHSWVLKNILRLRQDAQRCIQVDENLVYSWAHNNTPFSAKGAYEVLSNAEEVVKWAELVWNGVSHPKHSFCTWLAIQNKLYTRDRIWSLVEDQRHCSFCNS
ncbi:hypothetical protein QQ045_032143 [Rhodiola kirilowii]